MDRLFRASIFHEDRKIVHYIKINLLIPGGLGL